MDLKLPNHSINSLQTAGYKKRSNLAINSLFHYMNSMLNCMQALFIYHYEKRMEKMKKFYWARSILRSPKYKTANKILKVLLENTIVKRVKSPEK